MKADVTRTAGGVWRLERVHVVAGDTVRPTATVRLTDRDGVRHEDAAVGDGPVDAVYRVDQPHRRGGEQAGEYTVKSITEGIDAQGEVIIRIEGDGRTYTGRGADTDIIVASAKAYTRRAEPDAHLQGQPRAGARDDAVGAGRTGPPDLAWPWTPSSVWGAAGPLLAPDRPSRRRRGTGQPIPGGGERWREPCWARPPPLAPPQVWGRGTMAGTVHVASPSLPDLGERAGEEGAGPGNDSQNCAPSRPLPWPLPKSGGEREPELSTALPLPDLRGEGWGRAGPRNDPARTVRHLAPSPGPSQSLGEGGRLGNRARCFSLSPRLGGEGWEGGRPGLRLGGEG
ncbi:MAG: alpha-isopropylmalate synthase regulatory domain-containing protein [Dehalococcoidia bacterium]